jgi:sulfur carrier protein
MTPSQNDSSRDHESQLKLVVNGEPKRLSSPCTVAKLLEELEMGGRRVAVAVNRSIVVRSRHPEFRLDDGDQIEILEAVGGG